MTNRLSFLALSFLLVSQLAFALKVGDTAPAFSLKDVDGKSKSLTEFKGKYVVLEWYNKDCPFVRKHYDTQNMQNLQKEMTAKGVAWLQIISSAPKSQGFMSPEEAKKQMTTEKANATALLFDPTGATGKAYDAKTTPHMYVIDPAGKVSYMGAIDSIKSADKEDVPKATNYVKLAIKELVDEKKKAVTTASTPAYGCSIKYASN